MQMTVSITDVGNVVQDGHATMADMALGDLGRPLGGRLLALPPAEARMSAIRSVASPPATLSTDARSLSRRHMSAADSPSSSSSSSSW